MSSVAGGEAEVGGRSRRRCAPATTPPAGPARSGPAPARCAPSSRSSRRVEAGDSSCAARQLGEEVQRRRARWRCRADRRGSASMAACRDRRRHRVARRGERGLVLPGGAEGRHAEHVGLRSRARSGRRAGPVMLFGSQPGADRAGPADALHQHVGGGVVALAAAASAIRSAAGHGAAGRSGGAGQLALIRLGGGERSSVVERGPARSA